MCLIISLSVRCLVDRGTCSTGPWLTTPPTFNGLFSRAKWMAFRYISKERGGGVLEQVSCLTDVRGRPGQSPIHQAVNLHRTAVRVRIEPPYSPYSLCESRGSKTRHSAGQLYRPVVIISSVPLPYLTDDNFQATETLHTQKREQKQRKRSEELRHKFEISSQINERGESGTDGGREKLLIV